MKLSWPRLGSGAAKENETRGNQLDNPSNSLSLCGGWEWMFSGGRDTDAGELINDQTALKISTVYACVRVLSESRDDQLYLL